LRRRSPGRCASASRCDDFALAQIIEGYPKKASDQLQLGIALAVSLRAHIGSQRLGRLMLIWLTVGAKLETKGGREAFGLRGM
jgi:hypothetical protein